MRIAAIAIVSVLITLVVGPTAFAWDDAPPPPPPPPYAGDAPPAGTPSPLPFAYPDDEEPPAGDEEPAPLEPDETAVPEPDLTPADVAPPPAPVTTRRVVRTVAAPSYPSGKDCRPGCGQRRDDCCWPLDCSGCRYGRFEITIEGMTSEFREAPSGFFGLPDYGSADNLLLDGLDYGSFGDEIGGRVGIKYAMNPQEWIELKGTYYGEWTSAATDTGTFAFSPGPLGIGGAITPNAALFTSTAEAYSGELNWQSEINCEGCTRWDMILGARFIQIDETLTSGSWAAPFPGFAGLPSSTSAVENQFTGIQLGGAWHRDFSPMFTFTATLKGLLGNLNRKINISDESFFAGGPHSASSEDDEIVWGVDIDLGLKWRLTRWLALTGGYNFLMLDGVVRAHDAMDFTASTSGSLQAQQKTDQATIHSLFFGININL